MMIGFGDGIRIEDVRVFGGIIKIIFYKCFVLENNLITS